MQLYDNAYEKEWKNSIEENKANKELKRSRHFKYYLGEKINVLNHGHVILVDYMGSDQRICDAARVSFGKDNTEKTPEENRRLIRYMMKHRHTSPFEQVEFVFKCKMPIFVARQMIRHRTASVNEISGRYSKLKNEYYSPNLERLQKQSKTNKQGSSNEIILDKELILQSMLADQDILAKHYNLYCNNHLTNELARINLPLSIYTEWYWKIDLHNLFHFLKLRLDLHAQYEIRVYAEAIASLVKQLVPLSYSAFEDYVLKAQTFSKDEMAELKQQFQIFNKTGHFYIKDIYRNLIKTLSKREVEDFFNKLGIKINYDKL